MDPCCPPQQVLALCNCSKWPFESSGASWAPKKPTCPFCASPAKSSLVLLLQQKLLLILTEALPETYCFLILWRQGFLVITLALWYYPVCKALCTSLPVRVHMCKPCASESPSSSTKVHLWIQTSSSTLCSSSTFCDSMNSEDSGCRINLFIIRSSIVWGAAKKCFHLTFPSIWDGNKQSTVTSVSFHSHSILRYEFPCVVGGKGKKAQHVEIATLESSVFCKTSGNRRATTSLWALSHCTAGEGPSGLKELPPGQFQGKKRA